MNRSRMIILAVVALILSGGVTYLAYRVLQTRLQPAEVTTKVVVAAKKLDLGMRLTQDDVRLTEWPKSAISEGSFSDPALVVDRALMVSVEANEPILESKLAPTEAGAGLTAVIPEGKRALTIQVNSIIGVGGFVVPGSHVDLILTAVPPRGVKGAKGSEMASKIILENLEVLAAGQNVQRDVNGKPQSVQDVTLLLSPEQAQKVALATGDGRIQLALRNPMDKDAAEPPLVVRTTLYTGPTMDDGLRTENETVDGGTLSASADNSSVKAAAPKKREAPVRVVETPPPPPPIRVVSVELIQGTRRVKQNFEEERETDGEQSGSLQDSNQNTDER